MEDNNFHKELTSKYYRFHDIVGKKGVPKYFLYLPLDNGSTLLLWLLKLELPFIYC